LASTPASATGPPVEALVKLPSSALISSVWSAVKYNRPFCNAAMSVAALGLPDKARSSTPCRTPLKLPDASSTSGSSARAATGQQIPESSSRTSTRTIVGTP
jgi:hypothetical protein